MIKKLMHAIYYHIPPFILYIISIMVYYYYFIVPLLTGIMRHIYAFLIFVIFLLIKRLLMRLPKYQRYLHLSLYFTIFSVMLLYTPYPPHLKEISMLLPLVFATIAIASFMYSLTLIPSEKRVKIIRCAQILISHTMFPVTLFVFLIIGIVFDIPQLIILSIIMFAYKGLLLAKRWVESKGYKEEAENIWKT